MSMVPRRQGAYFEMCFGLRTFEASPNKLLEEPTRCKRAINFIQKVACGFEKDFNNHILMRNKDRNDVSSVLSKDSNKKTAFYKYFQDNLTLTPSSSDESSQTHPRTDTMDSSKYAIVSSSKGESIDTYFACKAVIAETVPQMSTSNNFTAESTARIYLKKMHDYLDNIKNLTCTGKNKENLKTIKKNTIKIFTDLSQNIMRNEDKKFYEEMLASLTNLSDKMINGFSAQSDQSVQEYLKISEKMWNLISNNDPFLKNLSQIGTQFIFAVGTFLAYEGRTCREKLCIYIRRVAVPLVFTLHEVSGYILTEFALDPFTVATGIGATGGTYAIGAISFVIGFILIHQAAHLIEDYSKYEERLASKARKETQKGLFNKSELKHVSENISDPIEKQKKILKQITQIKKRINPSSIENLTSLNSACNENEKNAEFFEEIKSLFEGKDKTKLTKEIDYLLRLAHHSINNSSAIPLLEDKLSVLVKKITLKICNQLKDPGAPVANDLKDFIELNILYRSQKLAENKLPWRYKIFKMLLKLAVFETTDYILDNIAIQGTVSLKESLSSADDISKAFAINGANIGMQLVAFIPLFAIFKFPQIYVQKKFEQWERETIQIANEYIEQSVLKNLDEKTEEHADDIGLFNNMEINNFRQHMLRLKNTDKIKIKKEKFIQNVGSTLKNIKMYRTSRDKDYLFFESSVKHGEQELFASMKSYCTSLFSLLTEETNKQDIFKSEIDKITDFETLENEIRGVMRKVYISSALDQDELEMKIESINIAGKKVKNQIKTVVPHSQKEAQIPIFITSRSQTFQ